MLENGKLVLFSVVEVCVDYGSVSCLFCAMFMVFYAMFLLCVDVVCVCRSFTGVCGVSYV